MDSIKTLQLFLKDLKDAEVSGSADKTTIAYINMLSNLNEMLLATKDTKSFRALTGEVSGTIYRDYLDAYNSMVKPNLDQKANKTKPTSESPELGVVFGLAGVDMQDIPRGTRKKLAEILSILGLPEEEVGKQLDL